MRFHQASPDNSKCWYSEDEAHLRFFGDCPNQFNATIIGHTGIVRPEFRPIQAQDLEFIAAGLFGEPRGERIKWTGDSYHFGIYGFERDLVIIQVDGSGHHVFIVQQNEARKVWTQIASRLPKENLWDLCMTITGTHEKAREDMYAHMSTLFLTGRLKKRTRNGRLKMEVLPEQPIAKAA